MNTKFIFHTTIYLVSFFLLAACDSNNGSGTEATADIDVDQDTILVEEGDEEVGASEADLLLLAYMNNRMQYRMGEIAQEKAENEAVVNFAESVITGDEETRLKLEDMAQAFNTDLPETMGATERVKVDSISELSAAEFEKAYLQETVYQYRENIDRLNELIDEADNPMTEGLAAEVLDIQEQHMERAAAVLEEIS